MKVGKARPGEGQTWRKGEKRDGREGERGDEAERVKADVERRRWEGDEATSSS